MKKLILTISIILTVIICTISTSAAPRKYHLLDYEPYVEDETTKIIDHVVYRLCPGTGENHYDVYDWFDTEEAFETVEEINIVPEIDGIKVEGIQCAFDNYDSNEGYGHPYQGYSNYSVKKITIPDTIKTIGNGFFAIFDGLEELVVPASVEFTPYNYRCFEYMDSLKKVTFLGDLTISGSFEGCKKLEIVIYNGTVEIIGVDTFKNCISLKSIELPETIIEIGPRAFMNCASLEEIVLPKEADDFRISISAFEGCTSLKSITLPEKCGELTIAEDAFRGCTALETVTLPKNSDSITIGYRAFRDCKNLKTVNNTDNITKIYGGAFRDCTSLKSFTISDKTTMIGKNAFYGCKNLKTVTVNSKTKAPKLYANAFAKTNSALTFTAKNATAAKSWKSALTKSGLKTAKVGYMHYV